MTKHPPPAAVVVTDAEHPAARIIGWSDDIRIKVDLAEPAIPPEDWHIVSSPERVLTGIPADHSG